MPTTAAPGRMLRGVAGRASAPQTVGVYSVTNFARETFTVRVADGRTVGVPWCRSLLAAAGLFADGGPGMVFDPPFLVQAEPETYWGKKGALIRPPRTAVLIDPYLDSTPGDPDTSSGFSYARAQAIYAAAPALAAARVHVYMSSGALRSQHWRFAPVAATALCTGFVGGVESGGGGTGLTLSASGFVGGLAGGRAYFGYLGVDQSGALAGDGRGGASSAAYAMFGETGAVDLLAARIAADRAVIEAVGPGFDRLLFRFWYTPRAVQVQSDPDLFMDPVVAPVAAAFGSSYVSSRASSLDGTAAGGEVVADILNFFD